MSNMSPSPVPPHAGTVDFVSGRTRIYGIVGHPIRQARSPATLTYELRRRGHDALLVPIDIAADDFDVVLPQLLKVGNLDGLVVTVPHKARAAAHMKRVGPMAAVCGAVSVLGRCRDGWVGEMFDGAGCVTAIENRGVRVGGRRVQLLGGGGAGSAIAAELARKGVSMLRLVEPDRPRGEALVRALRDAYPASGIFLGASDLSDIDILINATPVGMLDPDAAPIDDPAIPASVVVMDAIMDPERTKLLRTAEACGCVCVYGREMLESQVVRACDFLLRAHEHAIGDFVLHPDGIP